MGPGEVLVSALREQIESWWHPEIGSPQLVGLVARFRVRCNPTVVVQLMRETAGLNAEPNYKIGDGDDISMKLVAGEYTLRAAWGDCPAGCVNERLWVFAFQDGNPVLVREESDAIGVTPFPIIDPPFRLGRAGLKPSPRLTLWPGTATTPT